MFYCWPRRAAVFLVHVPRSEHHWYNRDRKYDLILLPCLWLRRLILKVNKDCEADSPKNDKLFYSRQQLKDREATEEANCPVDACMPGCGQLPPEGKTGFPLWSNFCTCWHSEGTVSWRIAGSRFLNCQPREASYFSDHLVIYQLEEEPGDSLCRNMYEQVIFQNRCIALMNW